MPDLDPESTAHLEALRENAAVDAYLAGRIDGTLGATSAIFHLTPEFCVEYFRAVFAALRTDPVAVDDARIRICELALTNDREASECSHDGHLHGNGVDGQWWCIACGDLALTAKIPAAQPDNNTPATDESEF